MGLKVYVSGMSGNKEVKKRQQRVFMILDSKNIKYDIIDITEPGKEGEKEMMQIKSTSNGATVSDPEPRHPLPPQIFNESEYCGDYDAFDLANEIDTLEQFLKLAPADTTAVSTAKIELKQENGNSTTEKIDEHDGENKENEEKEDIIKKVEDSETVIDTETVKQENDTTTADTEAGAKTPILQGSEAVEKMADETIPNDHDKKEEKGDRTQEETNLEEKKENIADKEEEEAAITDPILSSLQQLPPEKLTHQQNSIPGIATANLIEQEKLAASD